MNYVKKDVNFDLIDKDSYEPTTMNIIPRQKIKPF